MARFIASNSGWVGCGCNSMRELTSNGPRCRRAKPPISRHLLRRTLASKYRAAEKTGLQRTGCGFAPCPRFTAVAEGSAKNRYFTGENRDVEPVTIGSWCRKRDSNPRPRHYE